MKISIKTLVIFLALSIILNGCNVYYRKEVTYNEAYLSKKPVRLITIENKKVHLDKIILKDTAYYGVYHYKGEKVDIPLSKEAHKSLRIKNKGASTFLNISGSLLTLEILRLVFFPPW